MCWSFGASAIFAAIGFIVAGYLAYKKEEKLLWIPIGYFAIMELLQTLAYLTLNNCNSPFNQLITYLSYLHISFQPFFINMVILYFIPKEARKKMYTLVFSLCFIGTVMILVQAYPFTWAGSCNPAQNLCGPQICSMSGSWHLAWAIPLNGIPLLLVMGYFLTAFVLPLLYGSWKAVGYHVLIGPVLSVLLTTNSHEVPAIWCLFSIGLIFLGLFTPLRKFLKVKKWYFWKYPVR